MYRLILLVLTILLLHTHTTAQQFPDCKKCHKYMDTKKVVHPAITAMGCTSCHTQPHQKDAKFPRFLFAELPELCFGCHDSQGFQMKFKHPPVAEGQCLMCHDVHSSDNEKLLLQPQPQLCYMCHGEDMFTNKTVHPPVQAGMCTDCHNPHSNVASRMLPAEPPELCFNCHDKEQYISDKKQYHHSPVYRGLCLECHNPHATPANRLLKAEVPDLCWKCHLKEGFQRATVHPPVGEGLCLSCHNPHQADAKKLTVDKLPYLCFNCHGEEQFTQKVSHPPVASGMCMSCHEPHSSTSVALLQQPINKTCLLCHPRIPKSPHAVTFFTGQGHPLEGRKDPRSKYGILTCASCHNPHSSEYMRLFRYPATEVYDLCKNCHKYAAE